MNSEIINNLIKRLDKKFTYSLMQLEEAASEINQQLFLNPEFVPQNLTPVIIKHADIRDKSISYLKFMLKLRSYLSMHDKHLLSIERTTGIRIDSISEMLMIEDKAYKLYRGLNKAPIKFNPYIPRIQQEFIEKNFEQFQKNDKFEACSLLQEMKYSYN